MPDTPGLAYERAPLGDFTETELVLLASILRSGFKVRGHSAEDVGFAQALDARLRQAVSGELRARGVAENAHAGHLVERAVSRLIDEAKR